MILLIDLMSSSPKNSFGCSPCGKDKCLYAIFSSGATLSRHNGSKYWLSFSNIIAESAHFFNEAFTNSNSPGGSVNLVPLYKESKKKQATFWFLRKSFCEF